MRMEIKSPALENRGQGTLGSCWAVTPGPPVPHGILCRIDKVPYHFVKHSREGEVSLQLDKKTYLLPNVTYSVDSNDQRRETYDQSC